MVLPSITAMESLGVLLLHPMNGYLEQELDRVFRFWDSPPDGRAEFLRANASAIRAVVGNAGYNADAALIDALPSLENVASSVGIDRVDLTKCRERGIHAHRRAHRRRRPRHLRGKEDHAWGPLYARRLVEGKGDYIVTIQCIL